jgi:CRP-like cAMP-binding protein
LPTIMQEERGVSAFGDAISFCKLHATERTPHRVHTMAVIMMEHVPAFANNVPYRLLVDCCKKMHYSTEPAHTRFNDEDDGSVVFRIVLSGKVLQTRRLGTARLPIGFLAAGDTLGLSAMVEIVPPGIQYTVVSDAGSEFACIRKFDWERTLRQFFERQLSEYATVLSRAPAFAEWPLAALRGVVGSSRVVTAPPGALVMRQGDASDELFVVRSGEVRLLKSMLTREVARWPSTKAPMQPGSRATSARLSSRGEHGHSSPRARPSWGPPPSRPSPMAVAETPGEADPITEEGVTTCHRLVVAGGAVEANCFGHDEALAVIIRLATARTSVSLGGAVSPGHPSISIPPPIRRNANAFCISTVHALAIAPLLLMIHAPKPELLGALVAAFGGRALSSTAFTERLLRERKWTRYKERELAAHALARSAPTVFKLCIGSRSETPKFVVGNHSRPASAAPDSRSLDSAGAARASSRLGYGLDELNEHMQAVVNGAAAAELLEAPGELGATLVEWSMRRVREHVKPRRATQHGKASVVGPT